MEQAGLLSLLEADKEMVMASLAKDRALPAAQAVLEKAVDRVMYRYMEQCDSAELRDSAQYLLQTLKNTLPMMDVVGEARAWKKEADSRGRGKNKPGALAIGLLLLGLVLIFAAVIGVLVAGKMAGALAFVKALLPVALGAGSLYGAGILTAKPKKREEPGQENVRTEYLVDGEKAWHCLRGAVLMADDQLERIRQERAISLEQAEQAPKREVPKGELDLFAELLESAYASRDDNARETVSAIRFYLHNAGIDVMDLEEGRENWFEFLPAGKSGTIRPALVRGGKLVKKGVASR
ncbi:MAG: hypothetical protein Q4C10_08500 [Clostridia bacterium]|nr:hypothetical protein [Clostridia bacterium]